MVLYVDEFFMVIRIFGVVFNFGKNGVLVFKEVFIVVDCEVKEDI